MRYPILITLLVMLLGGPVAATESDMRSERSYAPSATDMIVDGLVVRPLALAGTIVGTGIFLVTLPISALGGNVDQAGETLVADPARATFTNCLGCLPGRDYNRSRRD